MAHKRERETDPLDTMIDEWEDLKEMIANVKRTPHGLTDEPRSTLETWISTCKRIMHQCVDIGNEEDGSDAEPMSKAIFHEARQLLRELKAATVQWHGLDKRATEYYFPTLFDDVLAQMLHVLPPSDLIWFTSCVARHLGETPFVAKAWRLRFASDFVDACSGEQTAGARTAVADLLAAKATGHEWQHRYLEYTHLVQQTLRLMDVHAMMIDPAKAGPVLGMVGKTIRDFRLLRKDCDREDLPVVACQPRFIPRNCVLREPDFGSRFETDPHCMLVTSREMPMNQLAERTRQLQSLSDLLAWTGIEKGHDTLICLGSRMDVAFSTTFPHERPYKGRLIQVPVGGCWYIDTTEAVDMDEVRTCISAIEHLEVLKKTLPLRLVMEGNQHNYNTASTVVGHVAVELTHNGNFLMANLVIKDMSFDALARVVATYVTHAHVNHLNQYDTRAHADYFQPVVATMKPADIRVPFQRAVMDWVTTPTRSTLANVACLWRYTLYNPFTSGCGHLAEALEQYRHDTRTVRKQREVLRDRLIRTASLARAFYNDDADVRREATTDMPYDVSWRALGPRPPFITNPNDLLTC